ncbi:(deoxy)nucleoside triphosphate pyrophosphohydrolase [Pontibacter sp. MBLB2868]|uniref:(deoxy)nucleoside triphosphate pyrophosphohydrolase n=1 Tax=Pontibacter sp. MBLB2868 TaxID=3451555 RepID=UPI003F756F9E
MQKPRNRLIRVVCAIIERDGFVLITQRSEQMSQPLQWEFPGGKVESGESEKECLLREIKEELHIEIRPLKRLNPVQHSYPALQIELIPYICHFQNGKVLLSEHLRYEWVPASRFLNYDWCAADLPIVKEYMLLRQQGN